MELKEFRSKLTQIKDTAGLIIDKLNDYFLSMKIEADQEIAYKNGEGYYLIYKNGDGYHFNVYDTNYHLVKEKTENIDYSSLLEFQDKVFAEAGTNQEYLVLCNSEYLREQVEKVTQEIRMDEYDTSEKILGSAIEHSGPKIKIK